MAASPHWDTPYSGKTVTSVPATPIHHFRGREPSPRLLHSVQTKVIEPKSAVFSGDGRFLFIQNAVLGVSLDAPLKQ